MKVRYDEDKKLLTVSSKNPKTGEVYDVVSVNCILSQPLDNDSSLASISAYNKGMATKMTGTELFVSDQLGTRIIAEGLPINDAHRTLFEFDEKEHESLRASYTYDAQLQERQYVYIVRQKIVRQKLNHMAQIKMISERHADGITYRIEEDGVLTTLQLDSKGFVLGGSKIDETSQRVELNKNEAFDALLRAYRFFTLSKDARISLHLGVDNRHKTPSSQPEKRIHICSPDEFYRPIYPTPSATQKKPTKWKRVLGWLGAVAAVGSCFGFYKCSQTVETAQLPPQVNKIVQIINDKVNQ